jgi:very-short-patch-repair endonuclease
MTIFICLFCKIEKVNSRAIKNHEIRCKQNPNRKLSSGFTGKKHTKESNEKNRKSQQNRDEYLTPESRKILSEKATINNANRLPEVNEKISKSMKIAHAEGRAWNIGQSRWNNEPSYPEKFFSLVIENEFFDKTYIREYPIGSYSADFCWPHLKKVIEIDGDQHQRFEEYIARDKRKDEYLISQGYKILRVVWKDMYNNPTTKIKECYNFIHDII